jgi:hypothetical protein
MAIRVESRVHGLLVVPGHIVARPIVAGKFDSGDDLFAPPVGQIDPP